MSDEERVLKALNDAGKPLKAGEIASLIGMDKKEVDNAMKNLKKDKKIQSPKRCFWEPSKNRK